LVEYRSTDEGVERSWLYEVAPCALVAIEERPIFSHPPRGHEARRHNRSRAALGWFRASPLVLNLSRRIATYIEPAYGLSEIAHKRLTDYPIPPGGSPIVFCFAGDLRCARTITSARRLRHCITDAAGCGRLMPTRRNIPMALTYRAGARTWLPPGGEHLLGASADRCADTDTHCKKCIHPRMRYPTANGWLD
jgi:hypothetical protein